MELSENWSKFDLEINFRCWFALFRMSLLPQPAQNISEVINPVQDPFLIIHTRSTSERNLSTITSYSWKTFQPLKTIKLKLSSLVIPPQFRVATSRCLLFAIHGKDLSCWSALTGQLKSSIKGLSPRIRSSSQISDNLFDYSAVLEVLVVAADNGIKIYNAEQLKLQEELYIKRSFEEIHCSKKDPIVVVVEKVQREIWIVDLIKSWVAYKIHLPWKNVSNFEISGFRNLLGGNYLVLSEAKTSEASKSVSVYCIRRKEGNLLGVCRIPTAARVIIVERNSHHFLIALEKQKTSMDCYENISERAEYKKTQSIRTHDWKNLLSFDKNFVIVRILKYHR